MPEVRSRRYSILLSIDILIRVFSRDGPKNFLQPASVRVSPNIVELYVGLLRLAILLGISLQQLSDIQNLLLYIF